VEGGWTQSRIILYKFNVECFKGIEPDKIYGFKLKLFIC